MNRSVYRSLSDCHNSRRYLPASNPAAGHVKVNWPLVFPDSHDLVVTT